MTTPCILAVRVRCEGEPSGTAFSHEEQKCSLVGMLFHSWNLFSALISCPCTWFPCAWVLRLIKRHVYWSLANVCKRYCLERLFFFSPIPWQWSSLFFPALLYISYCIPITTPFFLLPCHSVIMIYRRVHFVFTSKTLKSKYHYSTLSWFIGSHCILPSWSVKCI